MSNNAKLVRSQIRQIVKDGIPEGIVTEMFRQLAAELRAENVKQFKVMQQALQQSNQNQLEGIQAMVKSTLEKIDERQKDVQAMILREMLPKPAVATEGVEPNKAD